MIRWVIHIYTNASVDKFRAFFVIREMSFQFFGHCLYRFSPDPSTTSGNSVLAEIYNENALVWSRPCPQSPISVLCFLTLISMNTVSTISCSSLSRFTTSCSEYLLFVLEILLHIFKEIQLTPIDIRYNLIQKGIFREAIIVGNSKEILKFYEMSLAVNRFQNLKNFSETVPK
jgi:hypothetical protein